MNTKSPLGMGKRSLDSQQGRFFPTFSGQHKLGLPFSGCGMVTASSFSGNFLGCSPLFWLELRAWIIAVLFPTRVGGPHGGSQPCTGAAGSRSFGGRWGSCAGDFLGELSGTKRIQKVIFWGGENHEIWEDTIYGQILIHE